MRRSTGAESTESMEQMKRTDEEERDDVNEEVAEPLADAPRNNKKEEEEETETLLFPAPKLPKEEFKGQIVIVKCDTLLLGSNFKTLITIEPTVNDMEPPPPPFLPFSPSPSPLSFPFLPPFRTLQQSNQIE